MYSRVQKLRRVRGGSYTGQLLDKGSILRVGLHRERHTMRVVQRPHISRNFQMNNELELRAI